MRQLRVSSLRGRLMSTAADGAAGNDSARERTLLFYLMRGNMQRYVSAHLSLSRFQKSHAIATYNVHSKLDYCNSLYSTHKQRCRLQKLLNFWYQFCPCVFSSSKLTNASNTIPLTLCPFTIGNCRPVSLVHFTVHNVQLTHIWLYVF